MVGAAFFFEANDVDVYSGRQIDLDAWYLATRLTDDVRSILVVNRTDVALSTPNVDYDFQVVQELPVLPGALYLDPVRGPPLSTIDHSAVEWYVFGPASGWDAEDRNYAHVPQAGTGHCHSQHVMTHIMYERYAWLSP